MSYSMSFENFIVQIMQQAIWLVIICSLPVIITSLAIGLAVAIFSATTQIQESTLSFAPKMIGVYLALILSGAYISQSLIKFTIKIFSEFYKLTLFP
jgi:flagellar biosynthesis protein FliQ